MSKERWRSVVGYEGVYEVSSLGNIRRVAGSERAPICRNIKTRLNTNGYLCVDLCTNARRRTYTVHGIVARAFIPKPRGKYEIDHINGCPSDNRIINLRDVSVAENGWNRKGAMRNNKTGVLGVCKMDGMFIAQIGVDGRQLRLGAFDTVEEAAAAYNAAKAVHHTIE